LSERAGPLRTIDRLLADAGWLAAWLIGRSLRWQEQGGEHLAAARASGRPVLFVFWHNRLLHLCYRLSRERLVMMVSQSRDGDLIARVAHDQGIASVRGSSSKGGTAALRALARAMKEGGRCGGITPDGPRGPRYVLQPGALLAARLAGACIVPAALGFSKKTVFSSWDGFQVPWPFARARLVLGEPVSYPDLEGAALFEASRADLERRLLAVTEAADRPFSIRPSA
jgi:lysophospholipid acyltransferase (LPLAT)-like uncharacterized protein